ncbi:MAG: phosphatidylethanolamine N-methyltransferase family protein [Chitinophagales bacterium]|jgi:hypothetical protein|nr:phosphatidylethanolamine N-methyltransferase family protein [Chitinophagales bacterium]
MITSLKNNILFKSVRAILEMSGLLFHKRNPIFITLLGLIVLEIVAFTYIPFLNSKSFVLYYSIIWFFFRQWFVFNSFTKNGIAVRLLNKYGEEKASDLYMAMTAFCFWYRARSYGLLVHHTSYDFFPEFKAYFPTLFQIFGIDINILVLIGYVFAIIGLVINTWSYVLIERETYYMIDMVVGRFLVPFKNSGPYKWFANPMYGPGQLPSYGVALAAGSVTCLLLTVLNQIFVYMFYYNFEKPHIQRTIAKMNQTQNIQ